MCGLTGFLTLESACDQQHNTQVLRKMADAIQHRGPDSEGFWSDHPSGIHLGHRRLAVIDVSPAGAQPMTSVSGRFVAVFNGEVYNHLRLRRILESERPVCAPWRGHSDTETLLAGIEAWGLEGTLRRATGMFAIALWDKQTRRLTLARDRFGEKPVYYGWQGMGKNAVFLFGSELSALRRHPSFESKVSVTGLSLFMKHGNIGGKNSIYSDIYKLPPGHMLDVSRQSTIPVVRQWWSAAMAASQGAANPFIGTPEQAIDALEMVLGDAVNGQMIGDVPIGAFLSGGIDSSAIVAMMQSRSKQPVRTFSIGFQDADYDEATHAKSIAMHLRTIHTELYVSDNEALAVIPKLPLLYSEPFADSSQIPTFLVSELARQQVTVALSGDGGDELFCGYTRYQMTEKLWPTLSRFPSGLRRFIARLITSVPAGNWGKLGSALPFAHVGEKFHKGASALGSESIEELHQKLISQWENQTNVVRNATEPAKIWSVIMSDIDGLGNTERMMLLDILSYLPDDILVKVDRAAMGVGLETRVPFLDNSVANFAWSLPLDYKLRNGITKWPLRQLLYRHVPKALLERPKMGFSVPMDNWLRGPLKDWAEDLLDQSRLRVEGHFDPVSIHHKWQEHVSGKRNWHSELWNVLMFQAWLEKQT